LSVTSSPALSSVSIQSRMFRFFPIITPRRYFSWGLPGYRFRLRGPVFLIL
jgi:hypothetical protein